MPSLTDFHVSTLHCFQSHHVVAAFCLLVFLYKLHTWFYLDPLMKLPVPPGAHLIGGHVTTILE